MKVLFSVGNFTIYSWGVMFVIAFLTAFFLILKQAKKQGIDEKHIYNLALIILLSVIIGSRVFHFFEHFSFYLGNPLEIFAFWQGGMTSYGGLLFGIFFGWLYIRKQKNINFPQILDLFAPYVALALAIGRIGCFLNWCCYGQASSLPWAISVAGDIARHPTQLYLLLSNLVIFFILICFRKIRENPKSRLTRFNMLLMKPGSIFLFFLLFYSVFRFLIDFLRYYENYFLGIAVSQWFCIVIFLFSISMLFRITRSLPSR